MKLQTLILRGMLILTTLVIVMLAALRFSTPPKLDKLNQTSSQLISSTGEWLHVEITPNGYWRFPASLESTDPKYISALLHYEDERFYQHPGVDALALFRASWQWLLNGKVVSGASTITMQLAKLLDPQPRTLLVKIEEIFRALQLELYYSKDEILEKYLSLVPMGGNLEGITAASYAYFGHAPKQLTWGEIALLVSLPQSPEARRPDRHPESAKANRNRVLGRLYEKSLISDQDLQWANQEPIPKVRQPFPRYAYHYAQRQNSAITNSHIQLELQSQIERLLKNSESETPERSFAVLVKEAETKNIIAYIGSSGIHSPLGFNDMVQAVRSPGSALKPFIYALAFESAIAYPQTIIKDEPINIDGFSPTNYDDNYRGELTVATALSESINIPAVKLLNRVGVEHFLNFLEQYGARIRLPKKQTPGLAVGLGGGGITLNELTTLYEQLTPSGEFFSHTIKSMVYESLPKIESYAYKTGTSYGHRDAWAIGYNQNYVIGVWTGRIDGTPIDGLTGIDNAKPLLKKVINFMPQTDQSIIEKANYTMPAWLATFKPIAELKTNPIVQPVAGDTYHLTANNKAIYIKLRDSSKQMVIINGDSFTLAQDEQKRLIWFPSESGFYELGVPEEQGLVKFRVVEEGLY